jgi:uncharacterized membrane protein (UPF0127 family)
MKFPLDILWIGGNNILGFAENAAPETGIPLWKLKIYSSPKGTDKVLEVNVGTVRQNDIKVGDVIEIGAL